MYKVRVVENHRAETITISGTNRRKRVVDEQKINFLAVELVDLAEVKDLGIDFADKKVYQLINDANKAKYYYD